MDAHANEAATATPLALRPLSRLLAERGMRPAGADRPGQGEVAFEVSQDWLQGRTCFGGLIAALGVQAMRDIAGPHWPADVSLRALQTNFVGPVGEGPVEVEVQLLREGRTLRQVQATLRQTGQVAAVMLGVFGADRASALQPVSPLAPPASHVPQTLPAHQHRPGLSPEFLRHFDLRWDHGAQPGSGGSGLHSRIHMRLLDGEALSPELVTVLLADTSPTPATGQLARKAPSSSVTWALELRPLPAPAPAAGWWRADNESIAVGGGLVNHAARLWAPSGELAALGTQLVSVFG